VMRVCKASTSMGLSSRRATRTVLCAPRKKQT
jgi:hypothetical protein